MNETVGRQNIQSAICCSPIKPPGVRQAGWFDESSKLQLSLNWGIDWTRLLTSLITVFHSQSSSPSSSEQQLNNNNKCRPTEWRSKSQRRCVCLSHSHSLRESEWVRDPQQKCSWAVRPTKYHSDGHLLLSLRNCPTLPTPGWGREWKKLQMFPRSSVMNFPIKNPGRHTAIGATADWPPTTAKNLHNT